MREAVYTFLFRSLQDTKRHNRVDSENVWINIYYHRPGKYVSKY